MRSKRKRHILIKKFISGVDGMRFGGLFDEAKAAGR